jgi:beta-phosphoglucomutase-like phosphatase (HAD superfamily)
MPAAYAATAGGWEPGGRSLGPRPGRYREGMIQALLFDFDGTLWDSETVVFEAYRRMYDDHGHTLSLDEWAAAVGTLDGFDPMADLELRLGRAIDRAVVDPWERVDDLMVGIDLRSGVRDWLDDARDRGLALGIVSSNDGRWIRHHLDRLGIADRWRAIVAADGDAARAKPNPVLYREALAELGVDAARAIAVEDSPHGIAAAKAAGLFCLAVPNQVTKGLDLTAADLIIGSFRDMTLGDLLGLASVDRGGRARD